MSRKKLYGIGINDADYVQQVKRYNKSTKRYDVEWVCPFYRRWHAMFARCYSASKPRTCGKATVGEEWHHFSDFKAWMETQDWEGKHLDKDLLSFGLDHKMYRPELCRFVPSAVNALFTGHDCLSGRVLGTTYIKASGWYYAQCGAGFDHLPKLRKTARTEKEAHKLWQSFKLQAIKNVVSWYEIQSYSDIDVLSVIDCRYKLIEEDYKHDRITSYTTHEAIYASLRADIFSEADAA